MSRIQVSAVIDAPVDRVFGMVTDPKELPGLLNPDVEIEVSAGQTPLCRGAEFSFQMSRFGFTQPVRFRVDDVLVGRRLTYRQTLGLFKRWVHTIKFESVSFGQTVVTDLVEYELPFGLFGCLISDLWAKKDLETLLKKRLERIQEKV